MKYLPFIFLLISCNAFELFSSIESRNEFTNTVESLKIDQMSYWSFNESDQGNKSSTNSSFNFISAAATNPAVVSGRVGNAIDCNTGVTAGSGMFSAANILSKGTADSFTLSLWVNLAGANPPVGTWTLLDFSGGSFSLNNAGVGPSDLSFSLNGYSFSIVDFYDFTGLGWVHIAITIEGDAVGGTTSHVTNLFVNGVNIHTTSSGSNDNFSSAVSLCSTVLTGKFCR